MAPDTMPRLSLSCVRPSAACAGAAAAALSRTVLEQLFVDAAFKAGSTADIPLVLERVAGRRAIPPERFIGWREAVSQAAVEAL